MHRVYIFYWNDTRHSKKARYNKVMTILAITGQFYPLNKAT